MLLDGGSSIGDKECLLVQDTDEFFEDASIDGFLHWAELDVDRSLIVLWQLHNWRSEYGVFECPSAHNLIQKTMQSRVAIIAARLTVVFLKVAERAGVWDAQELEVRIELIYSVHDWGRT